MGKEEIWKTVDGYSNYQFSNLGRAKSLDRVDAANRKLKGKILNPKRDSQGYFQISLTDDEGNKKRVFLHRMVAKIFLNVDIEKNVVTFIDGDKTNLKLNNLRVDGRIENVRHNIGIGVRKSPLGSNFNIISYAKHCYIKEELNKGKSTKEISKIFNVSTSTVYRIKNGFENEYEETRKTLAEEALVVYEKFTVGGMNISEIARECQISKGKVRTRINYAEKIMKELGEIRNILGGSRK